MAKKVTIRDVAEQAGVSISSVHFALSGKAGVSRETRERIRRTADEMGYQPNTLASSLKRKTQRIAVLLPGEEGNNQYYYPPVWKGIHDYLSTVDMNIETAEFPYSDSTKDEVFGRIMTLVKEDGIDGILSAGYIDEISPEQWKVVSDNNVTVVFINSAGAVQDYLCCVQPDYDVIGRTMAELITGHIPDFGSIFMCAGNPKWEAHSGVVQGFENFMRENHHSNMIYKDFSCTMEEKNYIHIFRELSRPDIAACASVYSQGTVLLGRALEESGKSGKVFAIGSDLSEVTVNRIRKGILNNVIQKNPYEQGYIGVRTLIDYLVNGKTPDQKKIYLGSDVVFRSNLPVYERMRYNSSLL